MSDYLQNSKKYKKFPYDAISKSELNYLHKRTLEMFKEVVQIFDKNNINYMICGGTLLGAVTRNGFFPWDDDIDICVVESDYNKAKICLINNLPDNMILQCRETDPQYYHGWVKVRDKNSKVHPFESKYIYNGVWIDIYCLMPFKANTVNCEIVKEHVRYLFRRYASSLKGFVIFFKEVFNRNLISKFLSTFKDTFSDNNEEVYLIRSASNVIVQKKWCSTKGTYNFEGIEVKSFSDADAYLKSHYGDDYMKLPPPPQLKIGINKVTIEKD